MPAVPTVSVVMARASTLLGAALGRSIQLRTATVESWASVSRMEFVTFRIVTGMLVRWARPSRLMEIALLVISRVVSEATVPRKRMSAPVTSANVAAAALPSTVIDASAVGKSGSTAKMVPMDNAPTLPPMAIVQMPIAMAAGVAVLPTASEVALPVMRKSASVAIEVTRMTPALPTTQSDPLMVPRVIAPTLPKMKLPARSPEPATLRSVMDVDALVADCNRKPAPRSTAAAFRAPMSVRPSLTVRRG